MFGTPNTPFFGRCGADWYSDTLGKIKVCQENGQSFEEADKQGEVLDTLRSVSSVPEPSLPCCVAGLFLLLLPGRGGGDGKFFSGCFRSFMSGKRSK